MTKTPARKLAFYLRVSTAEQNLSSQLLALKNFCARQSPPWALPAKGRIYAEKVTGKFGTFSQKELNRLLMDTRAGEVDTVLTFALDRIGNDFDHMRRIVREWQKKRVRIVGVVDGADSADETASGQFMRDVHGAASQYNRARIVERIRAGLAASRARGVVGGRRRGSDDKIKRALALRKKKVLSLRQIAAKVGLSPGYVSRLFNGKKPVGEGAA